jgi:type IV pilus assembly protein PilV
MNYVPDKQRGVSLVEVLVTLVLISLALLGSASLQVMSKRSNYGAVQRTSAAHLANDYLSRMRSNRTALDSYLPGQELGGGSLGTQPGKDCAGPDAACTDAEIATYEQWVWEQELDGAMETIAGVASGGLLEPTACVSGPIGGASGLYEVAIAWRGAIEHVNPDIHGCGEGSGKYGTDNEYRHVLVMQAFINN